jgi:hypothetical protein
MIVASSSSKQLRAHDHLDSAIPHGVDKQRRRSESSDGAGDEDSDIENDATHGLLAGGANGVDLVVDLSKEFALGRRSRSVGGSDPFDNVESEVSPQSLFDDLVVVTTRSRRGNLGGAKHVLVKVHGRLTAAHLISGTVAE